MMAPDSRFVTALETGDGRHGCDVRAANQQSEIRNQK
jgi:hypothetical protein